jgi:ribose-phosphate pyrophosphokinase
LGAIVKHERVVLFATRAYLRLRDAVAAAGGFAVGEIEVQEFPDGERYQRLVSPVRGVDAVLIGGTISDPDTLELYDVACAMAKYGARSLTLVVPYLGYSTMERATRPGEVVTAKTRARLLSAIPMSAVGNRVVLIDLHSEGLPHFFEGEVQPFHLYAGSAATTSSSPAPMPGAPSGWSRWPTTSGYPRPSSSSAASPAPTPR